MTSFLMLFPLFLWYTESDNMIGAPDEKEKSSMMEHEVLLYDLVIEGRRFCSAIACRILILGGFYDRE